MADLEAPPELDSRPQSRREWSGWLRSIVLPLGLVVAIVGGLLYMQSGGGSDSEAGYGTAPLPPAKNATSREPEATTGRAAPDFVLSLLERERPPLPATTPSALLPEKERPPLPATTPSALLRLSDLQGRPVLVNFWATWCTACRAEMPELVKAYETHSADGLVVLGVNLREADSRARAFADDFGLSFPIVMDRAGEVARTWRIGGPSQGLPSSYFVDREGVVRKVVYGAVNARSLAEGLDLILKAAP